MHSWNVLLPVLIQCMLTGHHKTTVFTSAGQTPDITGAAIEQCHYSSWREINIHTRWGKLSTGSRKVQAHLTPLFDVRELRTASGWRLRQERERTPLTVTFGISLTAASDRREVRSASWGTWWSRGAGRTPLWSLLSSIQSPQTLWTPHLRRMLT